MHVIGPLTPKSKLPFLSDLAEICCDFAGIHQDSNLIEGYIRSVADPSFSLSMLPLNLKGYYQTVR